MKILLVTNMYPYRDKAWLGVFVKEQYSNLKSDRLLDCDKFIFKANSFGRSRLNYIFQLPRYLIRCFQFRPQIIHSHHYITTLLTRVFWFGRLVYTVHEGQLQQNGLQALFIRLAIKLSSSTIFVNQDMYRRTSKKEKYFLPCGVNSKMFFPMDKKQTRQQLKLQPKCFYLFFPADKKRPEKNAFFLNCFLKKNQSFILDNNIKVIWGGDIGYHEMPLYMNAADILVQFSHFESDGMVVKEAMACDLPVISFAIGNTDMYLGDKQSGSIINANEVELKQNILFWQDKQSRGRKKISALKMDSENTTQQLVQLYQSLQ